MSYRRGIKLMGMAIAAVLAFSAIAAASASAEDPKFVPGGGVFPVGFTSTSGPGTLETTSGETVTCQSDENEGEIETARTVLVVVTFHTCKTTFFGLPITCTTKGQTSGTIQTKLLHGILVRVPGGPGVLLHLTPVVGNVDAEFECAGNTVVVSGSVLGTFPETGEQLESTSLILEQSKGHQAHKTYEEEGVTHEAFLQSSKNGGTPIESGEQTTDTITMNGGETVEITP